MTLIWLGILFIALVQGICMFALVDQYRSMLQIRDALRLIDTPQELPLLELEGLSPSAFGLPSRIDSEALAVVVLLSTKCTTCTAVARGFGEFPAPGWAVIAANSTDQIEGFEESVGLSGSRVIRDVGGRVADRMKIRTFPTAIVFAAGAAVNLRTIPSHRQLRRLLESEARAVAGVN